jgi:hypothetical protein
VRLARGELAVQSVEGSAGNDPDRLCQARFLAGQLLLARGEPAQAVRWFQEAVATRRAARPEFHAARAELRRLGF